MLKKLDDPVMNKAVRVIIDMSQDTQIREKARLREKALHDEAFYMEGAKAEGIEIGIKKGRAEGREEGISIGEARMIKKMRSSGMSDEEIERVLKQ